jgi:hypothetical protein
MALSLKAFAEPDYPLPKYTPVLAGLVGAGVALLSGRERTRIDNFAVGGIFTALAAYRDPRANILQTLGVAALEGLIWGVTDRLVPQIKEALLPAEGDHETAVV